MTILPIYVINQVQSKDSISNIINKLSKDDLMNMNKQLISAIKELESNNRLCELIQITIAQANQIKKLRKETEFKGAI